MKMNRSSMVLEYRLVASFDEIKQKLQAPEFADRLDKPLAYWALPTDRSSPMALMGRTLRELLDTPFAHLYATPGIGQKKIHTLIELLNRAAQPQPPGAVETTETAAGDDAHAAPVDASQVSEALWVQWQQTVRDHDLGGETLGRFAPSLQQLPRVIWNTPLDAYTGLTLAEIRALKTHGEKRVRAVLEVFGSLHALLARVAPQPHLAVRVLPRFVTQLEAWVRTAMNDPASIDAASVRQGFVDPLLAQLDIDAGSQITDLVHSRLRLDGSGASVRQVARQLNLTRARVYQLLNDVGACMGVRWPEGHALVHELSEALHAEHKSGQELELFDAVVELFFPGRRREIAFGPGEPSPLELEEPAHAG